MHVLNILWVVFGIGLMLVLNLKFKINSMVALLVAALSVGMLAGMDLMSLLHTMKAGFGNTLGELAIIVVFGAVIGKLMVDSGAAHQIAHTLLARLGLRYVQLSVIIIGLIFGLAMFYEVAFIMLAPLVIVIAAEAKIPFLKLAIPAVAAATTAHSLFPPQPGPVALVNAYGADMGMVYIYGVLVTIPSVICADTVMACKFFPGPVSRIAGMPDTAPSGAVFFIPSAIFTPLPDYAVTHRTARLTSALHTPPVPACASSRRESPFLSCH